MELTRDMQVESCEACWGRQKWMRRERDEEKEVEKANENRGRLEGRERRRKRKGWSTGKK